jgi:hypothetical protein
MFPPGIVMLPKTRQTATLLATPVPPSNRTASNAGNQQWPGVKSSASSNLVNLFSPQNTHFFRPLAVKRKNPTTGLVRLFRQPCRAIAMPFGSQYAPFLVRPFANCAADYSTARFDPSYNSLEDNALIPKASGGIPQAG